MSQEQGSDKPSVECNLVQKSENESDCLIRALFNVNVRLFKDNKKYRKIILKVCDYMEEVMSQEYCDYPKLAGLSGANIGIPFNIIAIAQERDIMILINPSIIQMSKQTKVLHTNCGSLRLPAKYPVVRREWVKVSYYDTTGNHHQKRFTLAENGATVQHEIDHNKGILITDNNKHL
jgi:peptide deformylase